MGFTGYGPLLARIDSRDRALFMRLATGTRHRLKTKYAWTFLTHLGGATTSILAALAPFFVRDVAVVGARALLTLILSHAAVQLVKRTVGRPRPSTQMIELVSITDPDRFSFPSGHSAAAMAVAFAYAAAFPALAIPLTLLALLVGASRTFLGVHFPGDVLMGQALAVITGVAVVILS